MDDPVLHRKMFRQKALKTGALKPRHYQFGAGMEGISMGDPRYEAPAKTFVKGNIKYTVGPMGNIIATERVNPLQIEYKPSVGQKISNKSWSVAERLFDPEGYKKNIQDIKKFGQYMTTSEPYTKAAQTVGKGIKAIGKYSAGYLGASAVGEMTGTEKVVEPALATTGIAQLAEGLGAGRIPLAGRAIRFAAGPGRFLTGPYGLAAAAAAAPVYGMYKLDEYLRKPKEVIDPVTGEKKLEKSNYTKQMEYMDANKDIFDPMSPDDMMLSADIASRERADQMKATGTPMPGSDLQTKGEIPQQQGTGGPGKPTPPANGQVVPAVGTKDSNTLENKVNNSVTVKKTDDKDKKDISIKKKDQLPSLSERLLSFAKTDAGNAFMLKFAAGLLSGKGNFGEVVGNALNPAVDLLASYKLKEDELAYNQLKLLSDLKGKQEFENGMIRITDKDENGNPIMRAVPAQIDKKTGETYRIVNGERVQVPLEYSNSFRKINPGTELNDAIIGYTNTASAKAIATFIETLPAGAKGTSGGLKQFFNTIIGVGEGVLQAPRNIQFENEQVEKDFNELGKKIQKKFFDQADDSTRELLQKAKIGETALRYFLANAFKQKDRLTNVDLTLINDLVETIGLAVSGKDVSARMRGLQGLLDEKMGGFREQIRDNGVSDVEFAKRFFTQPGAKIAIGLVTPQAPGSDKGKAWKDMTIEEQNEYLRKKGFK